MFDSEANLVSTGKGSDNIPIQVAETRMPEFVFVREDRGELSTDIERVSDIHGPAQWPCRRQVD